MAITQFVYTDSVATNWAISLAGTGVKLKDNLCKYNLDRNSKSCKIVGCTEVIRINRSNGLCDKHQKHTNDLVLEVLEAGATTAFPIHGEIIEQLIEWAQSRNYRLEPFFEGLGFSILGNIPDVSTLDGMTPLSSSFNLLLSPLFNDHILNIVDRFFPSSNNASYQLLRTNKGSFPARILAIIFASLVFCEEANRGDRWFYRTVIKDETQTAFLGGAMPIAYFAARRFNWGVEMKDVIPKLFQRG
jgi:hypothetical protein